MTAQQQAVAKDQESLASAETSAKSTQQKDEASLASAEQSLKAGQQKDEASLASAEQSLAATRQSDEEAVTTAEMDVNTTEQKDAQSLEQAQAQVASAQLQLLQADATVVADQVGQPSQLAADNASMTADEVALDQARLDLADATLRAPVPGTVVSVDLTSGQTVSAGTTTVSSDPSGTSSSGTSSSGTSSSEVVIDSIGSFTVTADATTSQVAEIQDGEQAVISPTGTNTTAYGVVTNISLVGTTSSGVTSYPVTIAVTGSPAGLYAGASADVEIITRQATNVLVVPTTAVHTLATYSYVYLLKNGKQVAQRVTLGATSATYDQVTSGLKSGQEVVIAALSASVPTSSSSSSSGFSRFRGFGAGGGAFFGGGGFGG
ncbi:MAG: efflux RND transporter periplasmic adaptor subunit [Acidimicrobiales bacterium]